MGFRSHGFVPIAQNQMSFVINQRRVVAKPSTLDILGIPEYVSANYPTKMSCKIQSHVSLKYKHRMFSCNLLTQRLVITSLHKWLPCASLAPFSNTCIILIKFKLINHRVKILKAHQQQLLADVNRKKTSLRYQLQFFYQHGFSVTVGNYDYFDTESKLNITWTI